MKKGKNIFCIICNKKFYVMQSGLKYRKCCSLKCRNKHFSIINIKIKKLIIKCLNCRKKFLGKECRKFCCKKCSNIYTAPVRSITTKKTMKKLFKIGKLKQWAKGFTKETHPSLKSMSKKKKEYFKTHKANFKNKKHSLKTRKIQSIKRKRLIKEGKVKCFGHGLPASYTKEKNGMFGSHRWGKLNPRWLGLYQLKYHHTFTEKLKESIRNKFKRKCFICKKLEKNNEWGKLQIHHINYIKMCPLKQNLIPLCVSCNFKVNGNRDYWFSYFCHRLNKQHEELLIW